MGSAWSSEAVEAGPVVTARRRGGCGTGVRVRRTADEGLATAVSRVSTDLMQQHRGPYGFIYGQYYRKIL